MRKFLGCTSLLVCIAISSHGQVTGADSSDWFGLSRLRDYSAGRSSSGSHFIDSNMDYKRIAPGETLVLTDLKGAGMITHLWVTVGASEFGWPRLLRLRVYYDGALTPSVDAPLGDFFGVGHGTSRNLNSIMVHNTSFGRAKNSYWQMPFRKACRMTVTNEGKELVGAFYFHVDYRKLKALPPDVGYFHAYYRQERPALAGRNYEFIHINGKGQYVGTVLSVVQTQSGWFGEGDDLFYVDGAAKPQLFGTGAEDYFNDAWGLRDSDGLLTGTPIADGMQPGSRTTGYRWHVPDPIPFQKSLWAGLEHSGWTQNPDGTARAPFEERPDNYSSVAFWYQQGVNEDLPEPPYGYERLPFGNATRLKVSKSAKQVVVEKGKLSSQTDGLLFLAEGSGSRMDVPFEVAHTGKFEVMAIVALGGTSGDYTALIDGKPFNLMPWPPPDTAGEVPDPDVLPGYSVETWNRDYSLGMLELPQGRHVLSFNCVGKHPQSRGYNLDLADVVLEEVLAASAVSEEMSSKNLPRGQVGVAQYRGMPLSVYSGRLHSTSSAERVEAIRAIGQFGAQGGSSLAAVSPLLGDTSEEVRAAAAITMGQMAEAKAAPLLAKFLSDESTQVREAAAISLRSLGAKASAAVPQLISGLQDSEGLVRALSAEALGAIGKAAASAVPALAERLSVKDETGDVLCAVAAALGNIGPDAKSAVPALRAVHASYVWPPAEKDAQRAIRRIEGETVPTY